MKKIILIILLIVLVGLPNFLGDPVTDNRGWTITEIVSTESDDTAYRAILDVDQDGAVHIAWLDRSNYNNSGRDWDIFYKMKPRNGNWTTTEIVSTESTDDSNCLDMDVDQNGTIHIVWKDKTNFSNAGQDYDIFYKKKHKNDIWTITEIVSTDNSGSCSCPSLAIDKDYSVHVVWPDSTFDTGFGFDYDIFYKKRSSDGSWSSTEVVTFDSNSSSLKASVAVDYNDTVHVVWEEETDFGDSGSDYDIFYKNKKLGGNWTETILISSESTKDSLSPSYLIVDKWGTLHLAWVDGTNYLDSGNDNDIFYKYKPIDGNWSVAEVLTYDSRNNCNWPNLAVDQNETIHVVYTDESDKTRNFEIYYKKKTKDGNWSKAELVSSESIDNSFFTSIAVDDDEIVHVSWWDNPFDNAVVYYKKKIPEFDQSPLDEEPIPSDDDSTETPGFEIIFVITALFVVYLLKRKRDL